MRLAFFELQYASLTCTLSTFRDLGLKQLSPKTVVLEIAVMIALGHLGKYLC